MRRGDKLLEMIAGIAPLLGILGTIGGLYIIFAKVRNGQINTADVSAVTLNLGGALISCVTGISVAVSALLFLRLFAIL